MWTPRRLVLLLIGVTASIAAFTGYFALLGWIDGLPQLPKVYLDRRTADQADDVWPVRNPLMAIKLRRAFGNNCAEVDYNHQLELPKNSVILAMEHFSFDEGRCKLWPFSIAVVKEKGPGLDPEVYTAHADEAYLLFDGPVKNLAEMGKRRIIGCDLVSDPTLLSPDARRHRVTCNHNRGTADPSDDLVLETTGPVQYREMPTPEPPPDKAPAQIATTSAVRLTDRRGQPKSTTITAQGMKIFLTAAPSGPTKPEPKAKSGPKTGSISGVHRVVLPEDVTMNLWIDPKGGFLATGRPAADPPPNAERSNVQITTPGQFVYDVGGDADRGRFEMKPASNGGQPGLVQVVRPLFKDGSTYYDRLDCEVLELQFAHKPAKPDGPAATVTLGKPDPDSTLQWVHAWGQYLVLTSQAENMQAHGNDLFHDAATKLTTLKGSPEVTAIKEGYEIHAPTLKLAAADAKGGQGAIAEGEGYFKGQLPGEQAGPDGSRTIVARWRDSMHYRKEDGLEQIHLAGAASFEDLVRKQSITGDQLKLTMAPEPPIPGSPNPPGPTRMKPRRLEVTGRVMAKSPELNVHDTDVLVLLFQDVPAVAKPAATESATSPTPNALSPDAIVAHTPPEKKPDGPPKPPLDISAGSIQANLLARATGPTELDTVHCESRVRVHQDGATAQEKPVDMKGEALQLKRYPEGHDLVVNGDVDRPAEVHLPDLSLLGPNINLNQVENRAKIVGPGTMKMLSVTDFQGNKLAKPTELQVLWKDEMEFDGTMAEFHGFVQAHQENTRVLCHIMQVSLDKTVHFGQQMSASTPNGSRAANVEKVICQTTGQDGAQPVSVEDSVREKGKLVRYQRIESRELAVFKKTGQLDAIGPGAVHLLQPGPKNNGPVAAAPPANKPKPAGPPPPVQEEMKLTYIRYGKKLAVENEKRTAKFWQNVEVLHLPADDPGIHNLNKLIDNLPRGALYLKCEILEVYTEEAGGKKNHNMKASINATVQMDGFIGQADDIKYNEGQQMVIFEGTPGRPAVLSKMGARGQNPETYKGTKIFYNRETGQAYGDDVKSFRQN